MEILSVDVTDPEIIGGVRAFRKATSPGPQSLQTTVAHRFIGYKSAYRNCRALGFGRLWFLSV